MCKFVAYYRVSTAKQGESGLGLEAQQAAVAQFVSGRPADALVAEYQDIESGSHNDRPQLAAAMVHAKTLGATLVIAKLDRLSRDAHFLLGLQKTGVDFVAADMPHANKLTVGIMALVAEQEREAISSRTKSALAAAKARGVRLGNPNGAAALRRSNAGNGAAVATVQANADRRAAELRSTVEGLQAEGISSARGMARAMNQRGIVTARGGVWNTSTVGDLLRRLG